MKNVRRLNVKIEEKVEELQVAMKEFLLRQKLYRILLRGKGLEFESYRDFYPDDDSNTIDWKASMRANRLLVKQYREERNLKIVFAIDIGKNMVLGSGDKLKCEYAAEVVASLAHLITTSGDKVGFFLFNDSVRDYYPPTGGERAFQELVNKIIIADIYRGASDLNKAIDFIYEYLSPTIDSVVIVSDFISFDSKSAEGIGLVSKKFETVSIMIRDPLDYTLPADSEEIVIEDPKTGNQLIINPKIARKAYEKFAREQEELIKESCRKEDIDLLELLTTKQFVPHLSEFLRGRTLEV